MNELVEIIVCDAIALLALVLALVCFIRRNKSHVTIKKENNILIVSRNPQRKILLLCAYFIATVCIAIDTIVYWFRYIQEFEFFAYFFGLLLIIALSANYLLNYYFDYVVATDKKINDYSIVRKPVTVNISNVVTVKLNKSRIMLLNKEDQAVASFHIDSYNAGALIERIYKENNANVLEAILAYYHIDLNERDREAHRLEIEKQKAKNPASKEANEAKKTEETKDSKEEKETKDTAKKSKKKNDDRYSENQIEAYTMIGKEFRDNEKKNKRNDIIKNVLFQVVLAAIVVGFILISHNYLMIILFGVNIFVALSKAKEFKIKYSFFDNSDFDLGLKFAYQCPRVKGYHKNKARSTKTSSMLLSIVAIIITAFNGYMTFTSKPLNYNDTTTVTGELVEIKKDHFIDLTIKNTSNDNQYSDYVFTIPDSFYEYIEVDALTSEEAGQQVEMKITSKDKHATVLYLKVGEDLYVGDDTLDKHFTKYITTQKIIFFSLVGATIAILIGSFGYQWYLESGVKKEDIDLNA